MSYQIEKGTGHLVISGWENGIAENPYDGTFDLRNVNTGTIPKEVSVGFGITASTTSGVTLGVPISRATAFTSGQATAYYILDAAGHVFSSSTISGTWTYLSTGVTLTGASSLDAIVYWKGYLLKFRNDKIDYYTGGSWSNGWQTIVGTTQHFALVGQDDVVYFCNGSGVGSILEKAGTTFDPSNAATYTIAATGTNSNALALPTYDIAQSLAELGQNLLTGGSQSAIYPWNRIATSFSYPIFCAEPYIRRMVTANNNVFVFPGNVTGRGRIYITNGSQIEVFYKFPDHISGYEEPYYKFYDAIYHRNSVIFGMDVLQNGTGAVLSSPSGQVWAIDCTTKALRGVSDTPSGSPRVIIPDTSGTSQPGYAFIIGHSTGSVHGIGYSGTAAGTGIGTVKTEQIPVGTILDKKTFSQLEFKLGAPLESGESIAFQYISDLVATATIGTTTTVGAVSDNFPVNFEKSQWLQIVVQLTGASPTSGCRLKEIRLIP